MVDAEVECAIIMAATDRNDKGSNPKLCRSADPLL